MESCMRDPMAISVRRDDDRDMPTTIDTATRGFAPRPDPSNELYDRACDVVAAATDLRAAAGRRNNTAAVAATLRCLEAALERAADVTDLLREGSVRRVESAWPVLGEDASATAGRVSDDFVEAGETIRAAGRACGELCGAVGPLLAELTAI
jgi:hypothetical protein